MDRKKTRGRRSRRWMAPAFTAAMLAAFGCDIRLLEPEFDPVLQRYVVEVEGPGGLVQQLRISAVRLAPGDTLRLESVVYNRGQAALPVESRICGIDLRTDLALREPRARCAGYSSSGMLAPGDSVRSMEQGIVVAGPGVYTLEVRHLLSPELWVATEVVVQ